MNRRTEGQNGRGTQKQWRERQRDNGIEKERNKEAVIQKGKLAEIAREEQKDRVTDRWIDRKTDRQSGREAMIFTHRRDDRKRTKEIKKLVNT